MSFSAAISRFAIRAVEWRRWTKATSPTWSSRRRSAPMSSNIVNRRSKGGRDGWSALAPATSRADGLGTIYSFFDVGPDARKGLGTYIILDHVVRAARAGPPYVYLGYWVEGSTCMAYKTGFRLLERLGRHGWRRMDDIAGRPAAGGWWSRFRRGDTPKRGQAPAASTLNGPFRPTPMALDAGGRRGPRKTAFREHSRSDIVVRADQ